MDAEGRFATRKTLVHYCLCLLSDNWADSWLQARLTYRALEELIQVGFIMELDRDSNLTRYKLIEQS
jgi:hypothetical protein